MKFSEWLYSAVARTHAIERQRLRGLVAEYLVAITGHAEHDIETVMANDQLRSKVLSGESQNRRQVRHLGSVGLTK